MKITKIKIPGFLARAIIVLFVSSFFYGIHFYFKDVDISLINLCVLCTKEGYFSFIGRAIALLLDRLPILFLLLFVLLLISAVIIGILSLVSPLKEKRIKLVKKVLKLAINTLLLAILFSSFTLFISHFINNPWRRCCFYRESVPVYDEESGGFWIAN